MGQRSVSEAWQGLICAGLLVAIARGITITGSRSALRLWGRDMPVLCPVLRLTGHRCPGCGMTRAVFYLLSGRPRAALRANRLWPAGAIAAGISVLAHKRRSTPHSVAV